MTARDVAFARRHRAGFDAPAARMAVAARRFAQEDRGWMPPAVAPDQLLHKALRR